MQPINIIPLVQRFNQKKWERFNSEKVCHISYARIQGRSALVQHFQNSSLMHEDKRCRPILFTLGENGDATGEQEAFPAPSGNGSSTSSGGGNVGGGMSSSGSSGNLAASRQHGSSGRLVGSGSNKDLREARPTK